MNNPWETPPNPPESEPTESAELPEKKVEPEITKEKEPVRPEASVEVPKKIEKPIEVERVPEISIEAIVQPIEKPASPINEKEHLLGDFSGAEIDATGNRIRLSKQDQLEISEVAKKNVSKFRFTIPIVGNKTATEYDSKAMNYSTQTDIIRMENGRRVFAVYDYPTSNIHRKLANFCGWAAGDKMAKPSRGKWKDRFEGKSNIPTIENDDPNIVLLPFIPNVNASDVFKRDKEMTDTGECGWAKNLGLDGKLEITKEIVMALKGVHDKGIGWGEVILPNIIITSEKKAIIVDPEMAYSKDVSLMEQKARDLKDILLSIGGALNKTEGVEDYKQFLKTAMDSYGDPEVFGKVRELILQKRTLLQKTFDFWETARLGTNGKTRKKIQKDFVEITE